MAPLTAFIAMIKGWHAIAVLALTLIVIAVSHFTADRSTPAPTRLQDALFSLVSIPVFVFALAFLASALTNRQFGPAQLFPSVLIVLSAFVAVATTGALLNDPGLRSPIVILMVLVSTFVMSGLVAAMSFLIPKIWG